MYKQIRNTTRDFRRFKATQLQGNNHLFGERKNSTSVNDGD